MNAPVALVDCNNFYASCERVFNPRMKQKPIVVLSNNDGMIIARSNEAKELGIKMGEPLFKIKHLLDRHGVQVFSSNYALYGDMSNRVMTTLEQYTPDVEIYSIDEAFLNLEGFQRKDLNDYARTMQETVYRWTGIPVSVGVAETKTLAKIANRIAKKNKQFKGVLNIYGQQDVDKYLKATDVSDIWGVGRQYTKLLYRHNIKTAYDLTQANDKWIRKHMTVMGLRTVMELRGTPCIELEYAVPAKKAVISSRSFGKKVTEKHEVQEGVAYFTATAAEKMRAQKSAATLMTVFLRTNPFRETPQYHNGVQIQFPVPTDSTAEMLTYAAKAVEQIYREGYVYHKVGVMLTGFVPVDKSQFAMFETEDRKKMAVITEMMDDLNTRIGKGSLFYAATGVNREWITKAELRSPYYTTNWDDIPEVHATSIRFNPQLNLFQQI